MREEVSVELLSKEMININGTPISVEKKQDILELAVYKMVKEERWRK